MGKVHQNRIYLFDFNSPTYCIMSVIRTPVHNWVNGARYHHKRSRFVSLKCILQFLGCLGEAQRMRRPERTHFIHWVWYTEFGKLYAID
jgi:hypothetical protein